MVAFPLLGHPTEFYFQHCPKNQAFISFKQPHFCVSQISGGMAQHRKKMAFVFKELTVL